MYIVIWNPTSNDSHISLNSHRFIKRYDSSDDAIEESEEIKDSEHYRDYIIVEESNLF